MREPLFKIETITAGYFQDQPILKSMSCDIRTEEFVGIIGPNGAGKTTLLRCLGGLMPLWQGDIRFKGTSLSDWNVRDLARDIALVQQLNQMLFDFSVLEVALMGRFPYLKRLEWEHQGDHKKAEESLRRTDCWALRDRRLKTLSGGEMQRVMLARALTQEPSVLLLDEPTAHLDINHQATFYRLLRELNQDQNLTIIVVLHDLNNAALFCQRLILINDGQISVDGDARTVLTTANLSQTYQASVLIGKHPQTQQPHVFLSVNSSQ